MIDVPDQRSSGRTSPSTSPGKSMPVRLPNPNRSIHAWSRSAPTRSAMKTVPMLLD